MQKEIAILQRDKSLLRLVGRRALSHVNSSISSLIYQHKDRNGCCNEAYIPSEGRTVVAIAIKTSVRRLKIAGSSRSAEEIFLNSVPSYVAIVLQNPSYLTKGRKCSKRSTQKITSGWSYHLMARLVLPHLPLVPIPPTFHLRSRSRHDRNHELRLQSARRRRLRRTPDH
jgi:hypothetical protein